MNELENEGKSKIKHFTDNLQKTVADSINEFHADINKVHQQTQNCIANFKKENNANVENFSTKLHQTVCLYLINFNIHY